MRRIVICLFVSALAVPATAQESLPALDSTPESVEAVWAGYDPRADPLETQLVREWKEDGLVFLYVVYTVGTFKGEKARMAAFFGFPEGGKELPTLLHMHGGGQRALLRTVKRYAERGYATLSVNWGGRPMEQTKEGDPNTDWGAVDPTQNNVGGYSNLLPRANTIDPFESARNNNWFLLTVGCRRGITFLERQPMVDANRIGVYGHSMGGRLTGLVAGTDDRVKAASPSVGGSGFLQMDLWGLPGSARRVSGDLELFRRTIGGQAYLQRIRCPILYLSATNDFNAPMELVERGMAIVPSAEKRTVYAPHLNHRFTPETEISRPLWFDAQLQKRLVFPKTPAAELRLSGDDGVPVFRVHPDASRPIERVDMYYGYERDPRNRFWADGHARKICDSWEARCPVFDLAEPLFVFANVYYELAPTERRESDPPTFALSVCRAAYPSDLTAAGVKATEQHRRLIDDFARGFHDWYTLEMRNPHWWMFSTRKLADPRWDAPRGAELAVEITTEEPGNTLGVQIDTHAWRGYVGRRAERFVALVPLEGAGRHRVSLRPEQFLNAKGESLEDWFGITELMFRAGDKAVLDLKRRHPDAERSPSGLQPWRGAMPTLAELRWKGGEPGRRPKPFLKAGS